jgi:hypothetical protein
MPEPRMATLLLLPANLADSHASHAPCLRARALALRPAQKPAALLLIGCMALLIGFYISLPLLLPAPLSNQLVGRWQLQTQIRNGSRTQISGEYEFRSDYTTRKMTSTSSTRAGLWIIRAPIGLAGDSAQVGLSTTTIITTTYQFIDTLSHHIFAQIYDQQGATDADLWPGPGIYDITMIDRNQLLLRFPDAEAGGWIVLECRRVPE